MLAALQRAVAAPDARNRTVVFEAPAGAGFGAVAPSAASTAPPSTGVLGLSGLIRTLGQEVPGVGWTARLTDPADRSAPRPAAGLRLVDASALPALHPLTSALGSAVRGGSAMAPLLLHAERVREELPPHHLMPMPRGSLGSLAPVPFDPERKLAGQDIVVAVKAVGLDFRQGVVVVFSEGDRSERMVTSEERVVWVSQLATDC